MVHGARTHGEMWPHGREGRLHIARSERTRMQARGASIGAAPHSHQSRWEASIHPSALQVPVGAAVKGGHPTI